MVPFSIANSYLGNGSGCKLDSCSDIEMNSEISDIDLLDSCKLGEETRNIKTTDIQQQVSDVIYAKEELGKVYTFNLQGKSSVLHCVFLFLPRSL
jgi:hypothetical protein